MQIIDDLNHIISTSDSMFQRQLAKEDVTRVENVLELAHASDTPATFAKEAFMAGWTPGDMMTHELKDVLEPLIETLYAYAKDTNNEAKEKAATEQWYVFDTARKKRLMRCT